MTRLPMARWICGLLVLLAIAGGRRGAVAAEPLRVMPLGDSITRGSLGHPRYAPGGYRTRLFSVLRERGLKVDFVGSQQTNPDPKNLPDADHEGHKGFRIDQVDAEIAAWLEAARPDIVLLMIGANDANQDYRLATAPRRMETLIKRIVAHDSKPRLYVALAPGSTKESLHDAIAAINRAVPPLVVQLATEGAAVHAVNMFDVVQRPGDFANYLHPNDAAYDKIADAWAKAILQHETTPDSPAKD